MSQLYKLNGLSLAKVAPDDKAFLLQLYASSRAADMSMYSLSEAEKNAHIENQFKAQQHFFQREFPKAKFLIIRKGVSKIGRLYLDKLKKEIRLIDLRLMPSYRGLGIEQTLIQALISDGQYWKLDVTVQLEKNNSVIELYEQLGFKKEGYQGDFHFLRWVNF